jgi:DNA-binding beta-propeller fold protein YncE
MSSLKQSPLTKLAAIVALLIIATASGSVGSDRPALAAIDYVFLGSWGEEVGVFHWPAGLAAANGRVHVCNLGGFKVDVFDLHGKALLGFGGSGIFEDGLFTSLTGVAVADDGTIYTVDPESFRIQVFTPTGGFVRAWGSHGSDPGLVDRPEGIALDGDGNVLIADTGNHRIQRFSPTGELMGSPWGVQGPGNGQFFYPRGIAVGPDGSIYVADSGVYATGEGNHRIQRFNGDGVYQGQWGGFGTAAGQFNTPMNLAVNQANGQVHVTDYGNNRVQVFTATGTFVRQWGTPGANDGQFRHPYGIALDATGNVYVSETDNHRVQRFAPTGGHVATWGGSGSDNGRFNSPWRMAVGGPNGVYVADSGNYRIQRFTQDGAYLGKWGEYGVGEGQFNFPAGVALDPAGNVYVADYSNNRIQRFDPDGTWTTSWGGPGTADGEFDQPLGITVDADFFVYVTEAGNHRVQKFNSTGDHVATWGGFGTDPGKFIMPFGVAISRDGNLIYVADPGNNRIQLLDQGGSYVGAWPLENVTDLAVDPEGNIFAVSAVLHRVTKFAPDGQVLAEWGARGSKDNEFSYPYGIAVGQDGVVYVVDNSNHRIKRYVAGYPPPDPVYGLALNGSFEESPALTRWTYGGPLPVSVVTTPSAGSQGAQLAAPVPAAARPREEGWLYQTVHIPSGWVRPVLTFDYRIYANDTMDYSDFEVTLTQSDGVWLARILRDGFQSCDDPPLAPPAGSDLGWRSTRYDLTAFKDRTVRVRFAVHNLHANYSYGIWAVVDNVRLVDAGPLGSVRNYLPIAAGGRKGCDVVPGR